LDTGRGILKRAITQASIILGLGLLGAGLTQWIHPEAPSWNPDTLEEGEISLDQAFALPEGQVIWLDARTDLEYSQSHIPEALSLNEDNWDYGFTQLFEVWDGNQTFIVYCDSRICQTSHEVAERLRSELPGAQALVLKGGWQSWLTYQNR